MGPSMGPICTLLLLTVLKHIDIYLDVNILQAILTAKYRISTALIKEKPVSSPMVPPMVDNMSVNLSALSFVILSKVGVSK